MDCTKEDLGIKEAAYREYIDRHWDVVVEFGLENAGVEEQFVRVFNTVISREL